MSQQSRNTDGSIDLIDNALKHLEQDSAMCNSRANEASPDTSTPSNHTTTTFPTFPTYHDKFDADLDLVQCPPSPTSTAFNSAKFTHMKDSPFPPTHDSGSPHNPNSPTNYTSMHPNMLNITPSEHGRELKREYSMSAQDNHKHNHDKSVILNDKAIILNAGDMHKTAPTSSRYRTPAVINTHNRDGHPCAIDLTPVMDAFPDMAEDLCDWLVITGWHDVAHRTREINRHRKLEALEKQQTNIEYEKAALLRSYRKEKNGPSQQPEAFDASHYTRSDTYNLSPSQHRRDISAARPDRGRSASPRGTQRNGRSDYLAYRERDLSRTRAKGCIPAGSPLNTPPPWPLQSRTTQSGAVTAEGARIFFAEHREHHEDLETRDKSKMASREASVPQRDHERERMNVGYPRHIDVSRRGDTRFFVMKSYNLGNIYDCQDEHLATQTQNVATLRKAFEETKNVILFFSANGSRAFMGYARMTSAPSADAPRPRWWSVIRWKTMEPFGVEWLSKMHCEDWHVKHLRNARNEDRPVTRSRDGQEIEEYAGREMVAIFGACAAKEADRLGAGPRD